MKIKNEYFKFKKECEKNISKYAGDIDWSKNTNEWLKKSFIHKYTYNFEVLGRPIIQMPSDIVAFQELIWKTRPDLIIETGIAHGGSLIMSASALAMLDICDAIEAGINFNPKQSNRKVLGIDIDIRAHNRKEIEKHPMNSRIQMIQGSSISPDIVQKVKNFAADFKCILICLDSNHTHNHVLAELKAYASLTSIGSYCVVFDTIVEDIDENIFNNRPWGPGNNPKTAVREFLSDSQEFKIDKDIQNKLLITFASDGYLKRIK